MRFLSGIVLAAAVAAAGYWGWHWWAGGSAPEETTQAGLAAPGAHDAGPVAPVPQAGTDPAVPTDGTLPKETASAPAAETPETGETPQAVPVAAPQITTVRVEPDGTALLAGWGQPGLRTVLWIDDTAIAQAELDGRGEFVLFFTLGPSETARALTLQTTGRDGTSVISENRVLIAPTLIRPAPELAAGDTAEVKTPSLPAEPVAVAPTILLEGAQGVRVLQTSDASAGPRKDVSLDAITYTERGAVSLAGRGSAATHVTVYVDNMAVATEPVAQDGQWASELSDVPAGDYTLRVDQVGADGTVLSRLETPFRREPKEALVAASDARHMKAITVQPGATLWAISHARYGDGTLYVHIFDNNRDSIRNPHLIYPGQIFTLPDAPG